MKLSVFIRTFIFTLISALALLFQQVHFQKEINSYIKQNSELKNKLYLGHIRHLEKISQKDAELAIEKTKYSTYTVGSDSENYKEGYTAGYHAAVEQFNCPNDLKEGAE